MAKTQTTFTLTFDVNEPNMTKDQARAMLKAELERAEQDVKNGRVMSLEESKKRLNLL